jgi:hypothetical protein
MKLKELNVSDNNSSLIELKPESNNLIDLVIGMEVDYCSGMPFNIVTTKIKESLRDNFEMNFTIKPNPYATQK